MELGIRYYGDPVLRMRAKRVDKFDKDLRELAEAMVEKMHDARGIGLAAPQVGESIRLIVAMSMSDLDDENAKAFVLVNPEILERSGKPWEYEEGCLSIPGIVGNLTRPEHIRVGYQDLDGNSQFLDVEGMFARILFHEIDHLDGKLFIDYFSTAQKSLIKSKLKEIRALNEA